MKVSKMLLEGLIGDKIKVLQGGRRSGRTLGHALTAIGFAMKNPETPILLVEPGQCSKALANRVEDVIRALGLKYFSINKAENKLLYNPFVEILEVSDTTNGR